MVRCSQFHPLIGREKPEPEASQLSFTPCELRSRYQQSTVHTMPCRTILYDFSGHKPDLEGKLQGSLVLRSCQIGTHINRNQMQTTQLKSNKGRNFNYGLKYADKSHQTWGVQSGSCCEPKLESLRLEPAPAVSLAWILITMNIHSDPHFMPKSSLDPDTIFLKSDGCCHCTITWIFETTAADPHVHIIYRLSLIWHIGLDEIGGHIETFDGSPQKYQVLDVRQKN